MSEELRLELERTLSQALKDCVTEWSARTGITVEVFALPAAYAPSSRTVEKIAQNVYATVCEALADVEPHNHAQTVSIVLTMGPGGVRLTVSDNGSGSTAAAHGPGLVAMQAYFAEIGGTLTMNHVPGGGAIISGIIPAWALCGGSAAGSDLHFDH